MLKKCHALLALSQSPQPAARPVDEKLTSGRATQNLDEGNDHLGTGRIGYARKETVSRTWCLVSLANSRRSDLNESAVGKESLGPVSTSRGTLQHRKIDVILPELTVAES